MEKNIYLAGVGGQGLQVAGKVLAEVADKKGFHVTFSPKYGPQKRGGLTSCYIVMSERLVGNPRKNLQDVLLVMEPMAYMQFHKSVRQGGTIIVNSTLIKEKDVAIENAVRLDVPFHDMCLEIGNTKVISAIVVGVLAYVLRDVFPDPNELKDFMLEQLKSKPHLLALNEKAFDMGYSCAKEHG